MKKFLLISTVLLVVGALVVAKNPTIRSYCNVFCKQFKDTVKSNISPELEIERLKMEIARLDKEVPNLVNSLAVMYKDEIEPLQVKVAKSQTKLKAYEQTLLDFAKAVKTNSNTEFVFAKETYSPTRANDKLTQDFTLYQGLKATTQNQEKLLAAKQKHYQIKHDQVTKIKHTQQEFETKLTQLETELALLRTNEAAGTSVVDANFDNTRISVIQDGLKSLQRDVDIMKKAQEIKNEIAPQASTAQPAVTPKLDPQVVLDAITNPANAKSNVETTTPQD